MIAKKILSLQHPLVKYFVQLRKDKAFRQEKRKILISGKKMVLELSKHCIIHTLILDEAENDKKEPFSVKAKETLLVSFDVLKKITGLENPESVAAEIDLPETKKLQNERWLVVVDQISDPGNLGTLLRSALAFSWDGVILTPNTVDPFNEKALRAAKGATFQIPLFFLSKEEIISFSEKQKIPLYLADMKGEVLQKVSPSSGMIILSNESHGTSLWPKNVKKISIPISKNVDSLNVAVAGSILLYFLKSQTCV